MRLTRTHYAIVMALVMLAALAITALLGALFGWLLGAAVEGVFGWTPPSAMPSAVGAFVSLSVFTWRVVREGLPAKWRSAWRAMGVRR